MRTWNGDFCFIPGDAGAGGLASQLPPRIPPSRDPMHHHVLDSTQRAAKSNDAKKHLRKSMFSAIIDGVSK
jgi:hypothetical protein